MSDASPIHLEPGFYQILVAKLGDPGIYLDALTLQDTEGSVTILPLGDKSVQPGQQLWYVQPITNGNVVITKDPIRPPFALTYQGEPEPKSGALVIARRQPIGTEWHVGIAPGIRHSLEVAGTDLGIVIGDLTVHPPQLGLGKGERQLAFNFKRAPVD